MGHHGCRFCCFVNLHFKSNAVWLTVALFAAFFSNFTYVCCRSLSSTSRGAYISVPDWRIEYCSLLFSCSCFVSSKFCSEMIVGSWIAFDFLLLQWFETWRWPLIGSVRPSGAFEQPFGGLWTLMGPNKTVGNVEMRCGLFICSASLRCQDNALTGKPGRATCIFYVFLLVSGPNTVDPL